MNEMSEKYIWNEKLALEPINWIEDHCRHYIGEKKGDLIQFEPFQKQIITQTFGWRLAEDTRLLKHSILYVEIPRGNGKSTLATSLALYLTFGAGISSSKVFVFAGSKDQALGALFEPAKYMSECINEEFDAGLLLYGNTIKDPQTDSVYRLMSADWRGTHSLIGSAFIMDELHLHTNDKLYSGVMSGNDKRTDISPLVAIFTTAGEENTFAHRIHNYAVGVRDGHVQDESFLPFIYTAGEAPKNDPDYYFKESTWNKSNPGLKFKNRKDFEQTAMRAKGDDGFLNTFLRYNLNIWVGSTESFIPTHIWNKCNKGEGSDKELHGLEAYGGLYARSLGGFMCFSLFFPSVSVLKRWFWCTEESFDTLLIENPSFSSWVPHFTMIEGSAHDFVVPEKDMLRVLDRFKVQAVDYACRDNRMILRLNEKVEMSPNSLTVNQVGNGTAKYEEMVRNEAINHMGNPISDYMMSITHVKVINEVKKPSPDQSLGNISGTMADILAFSSWVEAKPKYTSVYETRGVLWV